MRIRAGNRQHTTVRNKRQWPGRLLRAVISLFALLGVAVTLATAVFPQFVLQPVRQFSQQLGYPVAEVENKFLDVYLSARGYYRALTGLAEPVPELSIDVKFREMRKIYAKREEALARGVLVQGDDDFVAGEIRYLDRTIPIKMRLKGDWIDHLTGRKWSFRIHVKGKDQLLGMRRFSIQNPSTRFFQAERLFFEALNFFDVLAPRYRFVDVTLNGESMGLMGLEEAFSKEILESNRRREGVIVRFSEDNVWAARDGTETGMTTDQIGFGGAFDSYRNAPVDAFGSSKIAESEVLSGQYQIASGLLNAFAEGRLSAAEVFDSRQMGMFLAVADVFGSWHALRWHNQRFYLNPVSLRLEPIGFDANLYTRDRRLRSVVGRAALTADMMRDPQIFTAYRQSLEAVRASIAEGGLLARLNEVQDQAIRELQNEYPMIVPYPLEELQARAEALAEVLERPDAQTVIVGRDRDHEKTLYPRFAWLNVDVKAGQPVGENQ